MDKRIHDIEKYLRGELTPAEMHTLEKQALDDPFLAEALEGAGHVSHADFAQDVAELNAKITNRKKTWMWPVRMAASLLLILVAAFIIWTALETQTEEDLALEQTPVTEDSLSKAIPQTQLPKTPEPSQSSPALSESKKETEQASTPQISQRSKKLPAGPVTETHYKKNGEKRVPGIPREKRLEEQSEVARIDPGKKDELQPPAAKDIKLPEGSITTVDARPITTIRGRVLSAEDGTPLRDVRVGFKGTPVATKTDAYGRYAITGFNENKTLVYSSEGLESTEVRFDGVDSTYLPVKLEITEEAQREAVVESSTIDDYPTNVYTIPAHPEKGNRAFKQYMQRNYRYPDEAIEKRIEGVVIIEFKVDVTGSLSEFKILRGIGTGCDEEVMRLILQGVKWVPTMKDGIPVADKARVRFKFELD